MVSKTYLKEVIMFNSMVVWPIVSALWAAIGFVGHDVSLLSINPVQQAFINRYVIKQDVLDHFKPHELRSWASTDIGYLNDVLKEEGYDICLQETPDTAFGVVSILDIAVQWPCKGEPAALTSAQDNRTYPMVIMEPYKRNFHFEYKSAHYCPIVYCRTTTDDVVCMAMLNEVDQQLDASAMLELIDKINNCTTINKVLLRYDRLIFPMIKYESTVALGWLKGLRIGDYHLIDQAVQQTKFSMDEVGAHAQSAVAAIIEEEMGKMHYDFIIDKPFLLWIMRPGVQDPIFAAYLPCSCWQDPKVSGGK